VRIIDLSQEIDTGVPVYPGHLKTVLFDHASHEETAPRFEGGFSFQTKGLLINDNGPTHVDSFSHLDPDPGTPAYLTEFPGLGEAGSLWLLAPASRSGSRARTAGPPARSPCSNNPL
jgi:kynurenine formamidase